EPVALAPEDRFDQLLEEREDVVQRVTEAVEQFDHEEPLLGGPTWPALTFSPYPLRPGFTRPVAGGTEAKPPGWNGWHFTRRRSASQEPRRAPCVSIAVLAYAEQDGWNRQRLPRNGLIQLWYAQMSPSSDFAGPLGTGVLARGSLNPSPLRAGRRRSAAHGCRRRSPGRRAPPPSAGPHPP